MSPTSHIMNSKMSSSKRLELQMQMPSSKAAFTNINHQTPSWKVRTANRNSKIKVSEQMNTDLTGPEVEDQSPGEKIAL